MDDNKWQRVAEDDPNRCQAVISTRGQCTNKAVDGTPYCPAHGANKRTAANRKEASRMYELGRYQARINKLTDHERLKSLQAEIGILRMILETTIKRCGDDYDLMLKSQSINTMAMNIGKLVESCNKLDLTLGKVLDENQAITWVQEIVDIVAAHISDQDVLNTIGQDILAAYERIRDGEVKEVPSE